MTDNALSRPSTCVELFTLQDINETLEEGRVRCNFVVLTINQCKAHANIYFHQFNSEIYIWRLSRVAFSWFTALTTMSGGALIFRINASDWDARTPYIVFLAVSSCWLLYEALSLDLYFASASCQSTLIAVLFQMGVNWISLTRTNSIALLR